MTSADNREPPCFAAAALLVASLLAVGCSQRQYLSAGVLANAAETDPELEAIRVYPSAKFTVLYKRDLGQSTTVEMRAGGLTTEAKGEQRLYPVGRKTSGAVLSIDQLDGVPLLWITFTQRCTNQECAYGFAETGDGLYRLVHVPTLAGYSDPEVYRKRITKRKRMQKTKIYSRSKGVPAYFTVRGIPASIALEIPTQKVEDTTVIVVPTEGVPTRAPVRRPDPAPPPASEAPGPPSAPP
jgi:hypothetical protein